MYSIISFYNCGQSWHKDVYETEVSKEDLVEALGMCNKCDDDEDIDNYSTHPLFELCIHVFHNKEFIEEMLAHNNPKVYVYLGGKQSIFYCGPITHYGTVCGYIKATQKNKTKIPEMLEESSDKSELYETLRPIINGWESLDKEDFIFELMEMLTYDQVSELCKRHCHIEVEEE